MLTAPQIANKCRPSNVAVLTYQNNKLVSTGSGVVMGTDKNNINTYIITCAHVVDAENADIDILTNSGKKLTGMLIGCNETADIAVVKVRSNKLKTAEFGNSDNLVTGCTVYALGNPGGAEFFGSITKGIISDAKKPAKIKNGYEFTRIQHDAAVNPGNSGGMLINEYGQVIGINSQKISEANFEGMSFAVPITIVLIIAENIIENS